MADISKISVNETTYDIKDASARGDISDLTGSLGALAYKDSATGSVTAAGTITAPTINVSPTTTGVKVVNTVGTLPTWAAAVSEETLSFTFSQGTLPTTANQTVVTGIASATSTAPVFRGTAVNVSVS